METIEHKNNISASKRERRQVYLYKQLIAIEKDLQRICRRNEELAARITPDMIAQAREHPIADLLDITSRDKALCPFCDNHMLITSSRYMCSSCNASGDPIDLLMNRDGLTFRDSIRRLM